MTLTRYHVIFESVDPQIADEQSVDLAALNAERAADIADTLSVFIDHVDFESCPHHRCFTVTAEAGQEAALKRALQSHVDDYARDPDDSAYVTSFEELID